MCGTCLAGKRELRSQANWGLKRQLVSDMSPYISCGTLACTSIRQLSHHSKSDSLHAGILEPSAPHPISFVANCLGFQLNEAVLSQALHVWRQDTQAVCHTDTLCQSGWSIRAVLLPHRSMLPEHPLSLLVMSSTRRYNVGMTIQKGHVLASHGCKKQLQCLQQRQVCCRCQCCLQPAETSSRSAGPAAACSTSGRH